MSRIAVRVSFGQASLTCTQGRCAAGKIEQDVRGPVRPAQEVGQDRVGALLVGGYRGQGVLYALRCRRQRPAEALQMTWFSVLPN